MSLELMDITRDWVCDRALWCFARPLLQLTSVAVFFVGLSAFSFFFNKWNEIDSAIAEYSTFFTLKNDPFLLLLYVLGHRPFVLCSAVQSSLLHLTESGQRVYLYTSEFFWLLLSSVTSSLNTSNPVPLEAMHAHAITLLHHVSQMILCAFDHELFQSFSVLFLSVILVQVDLNFSCPKNAFPDVFGSLIRPCLHLVVSPLYLLSWSLLLIVDFVSDTPTSWRVFSKRVFLYHGSDPPIHPSIHTYILFFF